MDFRFYLILLIPRILKQKNIYHLTTKNKKIMLCTYRNLKRAILNELKVTKFHRIIYFIQSKWTEPYIFDALKSNAANEFWNISGNY